MTLLELKGLYLEDDRTLQVIGELENKKNLHLKGLCGSAGAFIASAVIGKYKGTHIFVLSDKEEAAYFLNDLESLLGQKSVLFFPSSFKRSLNPDEIDSGNAMFRTKVLSRITNSEILPAESKVSTIIITYPESLAEKVVTRKHLSDNTLGISTGESISIDFITELLFEYNFEHADFVIEPGQFSVRGGIVDVYSFSNEHPHRIEFSGDEVASIRSFDPVTQLSINKLTTVSIIADVHAISNDETSQSFTEFIPDDTVLWFKDLQITNEIFERPGTGQANTSSASLSQGLKNFSVIEFGNNPHLDPDITINYNTSPQPAFNKNFELLSQDLHILAYQPVSTDDDVNLPIR